MHLQDVAQALTGILNRTTLRERWSFDIQYHYDRQTAEIKTLRRQVQAALDVERMEQGLKDTQP